VIRRTVPSALHVDPTAAIPMDTVDYDEVLSFDAGEEPLSPRALATTKLPTLETRPHSSSSEVTDLPDDMEVFELPPELAWLSQATSLPGAVPFEEDTNKRRIDSRASTPESIPRIHDDVEPAIVPMRSVRRPYMARPQHGAARAKGSMPQLPGNKSKPWSWRNGSKASLSPRA